MDFADIRAHTWFAVRWNSDKSSHHPRGLLHRWSPTHSLLALCVSHQFAHQYPLQATIIYPLSQPTATWKPTHQSFGQWRLKNMKNLTGIFVLTCKCVLLFHCGPSQTQPTTSHTDPSYHDPSERWSTCPGSDTERRIITDQKDQSLESSRWTK